MTEFRASVVLDATKATAQASAFGAAVKKSAGALDFFQKKTLEVTQGGSKNIFRKYENSATSLDQSMRKAVAGLHSMKNGMTDQGREVEKLNKKMGDLTASEKRRQNSLGETLRLQQKALPLMVSLNKKYDENARAVHKLKTVRNELNLVVASGMKTKKEALVIFKKEADTIRKSTKAYKDKAAAQKLAAIEGKKAKALVASEAVGLDKLLAKYDLAYSQKKKLIQIEKDLNALHSKGRITSEQRIQMLKKEAGAIKLAAKAQEQMNKSAGIWAKTARRVSIATRAIIPLYVAMASVRMWVNIEKTAESVDLLDKKLTVLTGDSGSYQKLFNMTQKVGIPLKDAGRLLTRFAVVSDHAYSTDAMIDWVSTLAKSARATGTSAQEMKGALIQITQAMSAGRLMGDEYRSVTENLPLLTVALRKVFKDTGLSLKEMSSAGLISNFKLIESYGVLKDMLKTIPGTTDTIEAKFGATSAAWDNFVSKMIRSDLSKYFADLTTNALNFFSSIPDTEAEMGIKRMEAAQAKIEDLKQAIYSAQVGGTGALKIGGAAALYFGGRIIDEDGLDDAFMTLQRWEENIADLKRRGNKTIAQANQERVDEELATSKKLEKIAEAEANNARFMVEATGNKDVSKLRKMHALRITAINDMMKDTQLVPLSETDGAIAVAAEVKKFQEEVQSISKKAIEERLRVAGMSATVNTQELLEERVYSGNVIQIKKKLADDIDKVNAQIERGRLEAKNKETSLGQFGGLSGDEGAVLIARNTASAEAAIVAQIKIKQAVIDKLTDGGGGNSAYERYLAKVRDSLSKQALAESAITKLYQSGGDERSRFRNEELAEKKKLNKAYEEERANLLDLYGKRFEAKFSKRLATIRAHADATEALGDAQKLLKLTSLEVAHAQEQDNIALANGTEEALDLVDAYSRLEGAQAGLSRGFRNFADHTDSVYKTIAKSTEDMLDATTDAFADMLVEGDNVFDSIGDSFEDLIKSMISDLLKLEAKNFIINLSGSGSASGAAGASGGGSGGGVLGYASKGYSLLTKDFAAMLNGSALTESLNNLANIAWEGGFKGTSSTILGVESGLSAAGGGNAALGSAYTVAAGYAGSYAGSELGQAAFGKQAESDLGAQVGGTAGTIVGSLTPLGPVWGAAIGSAIGSVLDVAFGGDGKKRVSLGFDTASYKAAGQSTRGRQSYFGQSGLELTGYSKNTDQEVADSMAQMAAATDTGLTRIYGLLGTSVDLYGQALGGKAAGAGTDWGRNFFGSAEFNGVNGGDVASALDQFTDAWQSKVEELTGAFIDLSPFDAVMREGETLGQVLGRVEVEFIAITGMFDQLGLAMGEFSIQSLVMADGLTQAFGGLDKMADAVTYYYDNFYTATEKANVLIGEYSKTIDAFNDDFNSAISDSASLRSFVDALDLTTAAGQDAFAAALNLAPAIVGVKDAMESLQGTASSFGTDGALSSLKESIITEKEGLEEAFNRDMSAQDDIISNARSGAIASERSYQEAFSKMINDAYNARRDALSSSIKDSKSQISQLESVLSQVTSALENVLVGGLTQQIASYKKSQARLVAISKGSESIDGLKGAISGTSKVSTNMFSSGTSFDKNNLIVANALQTIQTDTEGALSIEQSTLSVLESALTTLTDNQGDKEVWFRKEYSQRTSNHERSMISARFGYSKIISAAERQKEAITTAYEEELARLDLIQSQFEIELGVAQDNLAANLSILDAVNALRGEMGLSATTSSSTTSNADFISQLYTKGFGRQGDQEGIDYWMNDLANGATRQSLVDAFAYAGQSAGTPFDIDAVDKFALGGAHRGGLRIVGERGPELEYTTPSYITNSNDTSRLLDNSELLAEIKALRSDINAGQYSIAKSALKSTKMLDRWESQGMPKSRDSL